MRCKLVHVAPLLFLAVCASRSGLSQGTGIEAPKSAEVHPQASGDQTAATVSHAAPRGLRLKWREGRLKQVPSTLEIYLSWRDRGSHISRKLVTSGSFLSGPLRLSRYDDANPELETARTGSGVWDDGWYPDFGPDSPWFETDILFHRDEFYGYDLTLDSDTGFPFVLSTLVKALGEPDAMTESIVKNRMGAEFDNLEASWRRGDVLLVLKKRDFRIDEGSLTVRYLPISEGIEIKSGGEAPF